MSDVIFDTDADLQESPKRFYKRAYGGITDWMIKNEFAVNEREANIVLLAVLSSILTVTFLVFVTSVVAPKIPYQQARFTEWMNQGHVGKPAPDFMPAPN